MTFTEALLARRMAAVASSAVTTHPIFVASAEGGIICDVDGTRFIDFASGIAVMNLGHRHPRVTAAINAQLSAYAHIGFPVAGCEPYIAVCEELNRRAPIADARSALFTTGAEAVENAVKVARVHTGCIGVISFAGSFHGRTQLAAALTGKVAPLRTGVPPIQPGVYHAPFPGQGVSEAEAVAALDHLFRATIPPDQIAAIIFEPVQGEGGFVPAPESFVRHLRQLCDQHGICLIADEIQTGFGRTGKFFASEHYPVAPDIMAVGKALGGGLPLSGIIGRAEIMNGAAPGALGGTFAGNPVACAAALAVFATIDEEKLLERATAIGVAMAQQLREISDAGRSTIVGPVRQTGAMVAFDVIDDTGRPDPVTTKRLTEKARQAGVLFLPCGYFSATVRLSPPLTISDELLAEGMAGLAHGLMSVTVREAADA